MKVVWQAKPLPPVGPKLVTLSPGTTFKFQGNGDVFMVTLGSTGNLRGFVDLGTGLTYSEQSEHQQTTVTLVDAEVNAKGVQSPC